MRYFEQGARRRISAAFIDFSPWVHLPGNDVILIAAPKVCFGAEKADGSSCFAAGTQQLDFVSKGQWRIGPCTYSSRGRVINR